MGWPISTVGNGLKCSFLARCSIHKTCKRQLIALSPYFKMVPFSIFFRLHLVLALLTKPRVAFHSHRNSYTFDENPYVFRNILSQNKEFSWVLDGFFKRTKGLGKVYEIFRREMHVISLQEDAGSYGGFRLKVFHYTKPFSYPTRFWSMQCFHGFLYVALLDLLS